MTTYANVIENGAPIGIGTAPLPPWACPSTTDYNALDSDYLFYLDLSASEAADLFFHLSHGSSNGILNYSTRDDYYTIPVRQGYTGGDYSQGILPTPTDYWLDAYTDTLGAYLGPDRQYLLDKSEVTNESIVLPTEPLTTPAEVWSGMDRVMYLGTIWHPSINTSVSQRTANVFLRSEHGYMGMYDGRWKDLGNGTYSPRLLSFSMLFPRQLVAKRTFVRIAYFPVVGFHPVQYNFNPPFYSADYGTEPSGYSSYFLQSVTPAPTLTTYGATRYNNNITPTGTLTIAWHSNMGFPFERTFGVLASGGYEADGITPTCSIRWDLYPA